MEFVSKQTGSKYEKVMEMGGVKLGFREINNDDIYRVRIESNNYERLTEVKAEISKFWEGIKSEDHLSVVVSLESLPGAIAEATKGIVKVSTKYCDMFEEEVNDDSDDDGFNPYGEAKEAKKETANEHFQNM